MGLLVVPLARWRGLAGGDEALQLKAGGFQENLADLLGTFSGIPAKRLFIGGWGN